MSEEDLKYPVGKWSRAEIETPEGRDAAMAILAALPAQVEAAVAGMSDAQLDTPYRPGGWSVRQVVHHLADSHVNAYARMRLAITEDWPDIFAYDQNKWSELVDSRLSLAPSLAILHGLHERWVAALRAVPDGDWMTRGYMHPENGRQSLAEVLSLYEWHSRHHLGHILGTKVQPV